MVFSRACPPNCSKQEQLASPRKQKAESSSSSFLDMQLLPCTSQLAIDYLPPPKWGQPVSRLPYCSQQKPPPVVSPSREGKVESNFSLDKCIMEPSFCLGCLVNIECPTSEDGVEGNSERERNGRACPLSRHGYVVVQIFVSTTGSSGHICALPLLPPGHGLAVLRVQASKLLRYLRLSAVSACTSTPS